MKTLFDTELRALRRERAARTGPELFLVERAFEDCLDRLTIFQQRFDRALLIGCPDPAWPSRVQSVADAVEVRDPGELFAERSAGTVIVEDAWEPQPGAYDLVVAIGTLDTVNDLPLALRLIRYATAAGGLFVGAMSGGDTLPRLRAAMLAANSLAGGASAHVHPRIEPAGLAPLLETAGFIKPVVDVDRVQLSYRDLGKLIADLRRMGATNVLRSRSSPLSRAQAEAARQAFADAAIEGRTTETIEILHFAAWAPADQ